LPEPLGGLAFSLQQAALKSCSHAGVFKKQQPDKNMTTASASNTAGQRVQGVQEVRQAGYVAGRSP